jgi:hypothetical protein
MSERRFPVPEAVRAAFRRGLALHADGRSGDGLVPATVGWARRLAAGAPVSERKLRKMAAWHARHAVDRRPGWSKRGHETPGYVAFLLWGGASGRSFANRMVRKLDRLEKGGPAPLLLLPARRGLSLRALLTLWKALIQVRAHTRKDGTQVRAHTRNIQTRAERQELVNALARKMAEGEHTRHKTLASALGAARHASKVNGKAAAVYEHPDGGWVATHATEHHADHPERIEVKQGRAHLVRAGGKPQSLKHIKGAIEEGAPAAVVPKVKPARPKAEKAENPAPEKPAEPEQAEPPKPEEPGLPPLDERHKALLDGLLAAAVASKDYDGRSRQAIEANGFVDVGSAHFGHADMRQLNVPREALEALAPHLAQAGFKHLGVEDHLRYLAHNKKQERAGWSASSQQQIDKGEAGLYRFYRADREYAGTAAPVMLKAPQAGDDFIALYEQNVERPLHAWDEGVEQRVAEALEDHYGWERKTIKGKKKPDGTRYTDEWEDMKAYAAERARKILAGGKPLEKELMAILGTSPRSLGDALFVRVGKKTLMYNAMHDGEQRVSSIGSPNDLRKHIRDMYSVGHPVSENAAVNAEYYPHLDAAVKAMQAPHALTSDAYVKAIEGAIGKHETSTDLGKAFHRHREAMRKALADGKEVPAAVRSEYFEFADGPKLPKGPHTDAVIAAVAEVKRRRKEVADQMQLMANQRIERHEAFAARYPLLGADGKPTGMIDDSAVPPEELKQYEAQRDADWEAVEAIQQSYSAEQARADVDKLLRGAGKARYTAHFDPEVSDEHRAAYQKALDYYAELAGARAGHRHVVVRYVADGEHGLEDRAFYRNPEMTIAMGKSLPRWHVGQVVVHEMAHGLEYEHPDNAKASAAFVFEHTEDRYEKLNTLTNSDRFQDYEVARPAKADGKALWDPYLGKAYGATKVAPGTIDDVRATELVSMGMDRLYEDPIAFISDHPEHFRVLWGMLRSQE